MKQTSLAYIFSLVFLFLGSLVPSSLLSGLYYYHILNTKMYEWLTIGTGIAVFLIAGFILGRKTTKKALLHALIFVIPFLIIASLTNEFNTSDMLVSALKALTYLIGTVTGVNLPARK